MQGQSGELAYVKVDASNLPAALDIQHRVWPTEDADEDYLDKINYPDDESNISWLVYHGDDLIGITGVFSFDPDEPGYDQGESLWVDWLAILPKYRGQHFGRQVLLDTIAYAKQLGRYKYLRLDTVNFPGRPAISLYDDAMPLREEYIAEDTPEHKQNYLIYSCSLDGSPIKPWNNQYLDIGDGEGDIIN